MKFTTIGSAVGAALLISPSARANAGAGALFSDLSPALTTGSNLAAILQRALMLVGFGGFGLAALRRGPKDCRAAGGGSVRPAFGV